MSALGSQRGLHNILIGLHRQLLLCHVHSCALGFTDGELYVVRVKAWAPALDATRTLAVLGYQHFLWPW